MWQYITSTVDAKSMDHSLWEAVSGLCGLKIPHLPLHLKFPYIVIKNVSLDFILSQLNLIGISHPILLESIVFMSYLAQYPNWFFSGTQISYEFLIIV